MERRKIQDLKISDLAGWILGFSTLLLPGFSSDLYIGVVILLLIPMIGFGVRPLNWIAPYLVLLFFEFFTRFIPVDWKTASQTSLLEYIPLTKSDLQLLIRFIVLGILTSIFSQNERIKLFFSRGLIFALPILFIAVILQWYQLMLVYFPNQNEFWISLKRYPGTVTDPNALGVTSFLLATIVFSKYLLEKRKVFLALFILCLIIGVFSGSRTFVIGIFLTILLSLFYYSRVLFFSLLSASGVLLLTINFVVPESSHVTAGFPLAIQRTFDSLHFKSFYHMMSSRLFFLKAGWNLFTEAPLLGIGINRFEGHYRLLNSLLGNPDAGWVDNPNNFYLGVLAESGIVGALLLVLSLYRLGPKKLLTTQEIVLRSGIQIFGMLLFFGPHIDFTEVVVLSSFLLGSSYDTSHFVQSSWRGSRFQYGALLILLLAMGFRAFRLERGVYDLEGGRRWFQPHSLLIEQCKGDVINLDLNAPLAGFARTPLVLTLESELGERQSITVKNSDIVKVHFTCPKQQDATLGSSVRFAIDCSRYWIPAEQNLGSDTRVFCAQVRNSSR